MHASPPSEPGRPRSFALFPPAVLFEPIIPRDAQGSVFMYHREDEPLRRLLLDETGRAEIDRLWSELQFVSEQAFATPRMYEEIVQYYRKPNDDARIMFFYIQLFAERVKREEEELCAAQVAAEQVHLDSLLLSLPGPGVGPSPPTKARPFSLPMTQIEKTASSTIRRSCAARPRPLVTVVSLPGRRTFARANWHPVSGDELATRLSFLLWDSIPDNELRAKAAKLHEPAVMEEQLRRMLKDGRDGRGMAEEFGAVWLGVRDFVGNHGRSLKHFPEFTPALRDAGRGASAVLRRSVGSPRPPVRRHRR